MTLCGSSYLSVSISDMCLRGRRWLTKIVIHPIQTRSLSFIRWSSQIKAGRCVAHPPMETPRLRIPIILWVPYHVWGTPTPGKAGRMCSFVPRRPQRFNRGRPAGTLLDLLTAVRMYSSINHKQFIYIAAQHPAEREVVEVVMRNQPNCCDTV